MFNWYFGYQRVAIHNRDVHANIVLPDKESGLILIQALDYKKKVMLKFLKYIYM